ncbi:MAG: hypothetical protein HOP10_10180 [Chitinophagaceae bacterium]|nr:hypothetical protein [Chitinophagaceae bacterium]
MSRRKTIRLSLFLSLPVILFVLQHYFIHSPSLKPTGFTNEENVLYMSYAHQYLDQDKFSITYSNPFDGNIQSPNIYFQPITIVLAGLMKLGMDPGFCFSLFGLIMTALCIYLGIKILQHLLPGHKQMSLIATLFTWGGGLTALAGLMGSAFLSGHYTEQWIDGIYLADPANGWWGLNWGRTLFIPLEAYYHFLFLLNIWLILKQKWKAAAIVALFLSISHPFTGIEYLVIINGWIVLEKLVFRNKTIPYWFAIAMIVVTALHVWYYLIYLNSFPEHKLLFTQYSVGWTYSLLIAIPAYSIVAVLTFVNMYLNSPVKKFLAIPHQRLFLCWGIIAFLLSKHEWFIEPMQPIHFTRGYVWAGLFLFALPALLWLINYLQQKKKNWVLYIFIFLFLSDNILWTANLLRGKNDTEWEGHISKDTRDVLDYLNKNATSSDLLIGNATLVNYLANVYTHTNAWVSHPYNTPNREMRMMQEKLVLEERVVQSFWKDRKLFLVIDKRKEWTTPVSLPLLANKVFENNSYTIFIP